MVFFFVCTTWHGELVLFPADDQLHRLHGDQRTCFRKVQVGANRHSY